MAEGLRLLTEFLDKPFAQSALAPLSAAASIAVEIAGDDALVIRRQGTKIAISAGGAPSPDLTFRLSLETLQELLATPTENLADFGLTLVQRLFASDPQRRLEVSVHAGTLNLMARGYFSILLSGGQPLLKFLATKGITNLRRKP